MKAESLTTNQLYALMMLKKLPEAVLIKIDHEWSNRNFSIEQQSDLRAHFENLSGNNNGKKLSRIEKVLTLVIPFSGLLHAFIANRHISKGSKQNWKKHWNLVEMGYSIWTILILVVAKFWLFA